MKKLILIIVLLVSLSALSSELVADSSSDAWVEIVPHCQAYIEKSAKPAYIRQWIVRLSARISERMERYGGNADTYLQDLFLDWVVDNGVKLKQRDEAALLDASLFICQFYATGTPLPSVVQSFFTPEYLKEISDTLDRLSASK